MEKRIPEDKVERDKIVNRAANYIIIGTELYRRSTSNCVLMKCILRSEGLEILQEIHGRECGNHTASANLVGKAYRSTGPPLWLMLKTWFGGARVASSSPSNNTSRLKF
jgi:hypothetical protein